LTVAWWVPVGGVQGRSQFLGFGGVKVKNNNLKERKLQIFFKIRVKIIFFLSFFGGALWLVGWLEGGSF